MQRVQSLFPHQPDVTERFKLVRFLARSRPHPNFGQSQSGGTETSDGDPGGGAGKN